MNISFKSRIHITSIIYLLLYCNLAISQTDGRLFGYFANNNTIDENQNHTTITHIWTGINDRSLVTSLILSELADAKAFGIKAFVSLDPFLFQMSGDATTNTLAQCPYTLELNSEVYFETLVNTLIDSGYLVPNKPELSTVAAFYPVDEPELCGLTDQGSSAHPALVNAIATIRNNPNTSNFPIAVIASRNYSNATKGIRLYDWAGMDWYSKSTSGYLAAFDAFAATLLSSQRTILVPQAAVGGFLSSAGEPHDPDLILNRFLADQRIIGIIPFLWSHAETTGTRDIPDLREAYTAIGRHIKNGDPLPIVVNLSCINQGGGLFECTVNADRGTPPYSYQWFGASSSFGNQAYYSITCGVVSQARVTVTDSQGSQLTVTKSISCSPGTVPKAIDNDS